jgi:hypothetical protein
MDQAHLNALGAKHADLDQLIADEYRRPHPDSATLSRLKKEKLKIKEAMSGS